MTTEFSTLRCRCVAWVYFGMYKLRQHVTEHCCLRQSKALLEVLVISYCGSFIGFRLFEFRIWGCWQYHGWFGDVGKSMDSDGNNHTLDCLFPNSLESQWTRGKKLPIRHRIIFNALWHFFWASLSSLVWMVQTSLWRFVSLKCCVTPGKYSFPALDLQQQE